MTRLTLVLINVLLAWLLPSVGTLAASPVITFQSNTGSTLVATSFGTFNEPWAMAFLPNGDMLVTEKSGRLQLVQLNNGTVTTVQGVPEVAYGGQGGLGDVVLHPNFAENRWVYFSYAQQDNTGKKGAVVVRAQLDLDSQLPTLENLEMIWQQTPTATGSSHYSHRLAFSPDGYLFITSGDRERQTPAQKWDQNLGKIIRLHDDGTVPSDNPFQDQGELAKSFWTLGHRNMLGMAFDARGQLWVHEMGPRHGDELNLIVPGDNYGWPLVSWGNHYSGLPIPDHDTRPEFHAPELYWVPTIAPSGLIIYDGVLFPQWQGHALIGGLKSEALIRVQLDGQHAKEIERFDMGARIRDVAQGPDGAVWVLEDGKKGRLLKLDP